MSGEPRNTSSENKLMLARVPPSEKSRNDQYKWNDEYNDGNGWKWGTYGYICEWD